MVINNKTTNTIEKSTTNLRIHELNYTAIKFAYLIMPYGDPNSTKPRFFV